MNTFAPELSALIIILVSAGPVISTRRSSRSAGAGATRQSAARTSAVSVEERRALAGGDAGVPLRAAGEQRLPLRPEAALEVGRGTPAPRA